MTAQPSVSTQDPRPLRSEPLPLDLLNTMWIEGGQVRDLLQTVAGTAIWLDSARVSAHYKPDPVTDADRRKLRAAREAILGIAEHPTDAAARGVFNEVLARGHRLAYLGQEGPASTPVVDKPQWMIPWLAAEGYLDLLVKWPKRIRQCQHPQCVLWYVDTSPGGSRRWCSMTLCGNRVKAGRHYQRKSR